MADVKVRFGEYKAKEREDVIIKPVKGYVLVAGIDYSGSQNSFIEYVKKEKKRIDALANNKEIQIIYVIDILPGTITKIEKDEGKIVEKVTNYDKITKANFSAHVFDDLNKSNYITKNTIYDIVGEIGSNNPKSIMEMHIFSHAYFNGPILANSYEDFGVDIDMRISDIKKVSSKFSSSFNKSGYVKIWGCNFPTITNAVYSKIRKNTKYKESLIEEDEIFTYPKNHFYFVMGSKELDLINYINQRIGSSFKIDDIIKLSFKQIKQILAYDFINVYAAHLAYYSNTNVYSALPGTYADIDPAFTINSQTLNNVDLFNIHLNVTVDSENYGLFDKTTVERINKLKT
ncbi:MAG: hypothetical protein ACTIJ9_11240 [Aequorivita sp.]